MSKEIRGLSLNTKHIKIASENNLILERIGRIIMTYKGERVNEPGFGSLLETFIFNRGVILKQHVEANFKNLIETYEPRVRVLLSTVEYEGNVAKIKINVQRKDTLEVLDFTEEVAF